MACVRWLAAPIRDLRELLALSALTALAAVLFWIFLPSPGDPASGVVGILSRVVLLLGALVGASWCFLPPRNPPRS